MFERLREIGRQVRQWWDSLDAEDDAAEGRSLTSFRPKDLNPLPRPVQQALAVGAVAAIFALGGMALVSLSGLLFSLFFIYLLVTEVLGLEFELDPRFWQAL